MPKAYSYLRMSTETQLKGDSKRRQLELSTDYAKKNRLELVEHLEDIGVSAYKGRNKASGALGRFLAAVEAAKVDKGSYLLVESLDRLSRDKIATAHRGLLSLVDKGIIVVTLSDGMVYSEETINGPDALTKLIISLTIMSRAHEESHTKSQRLAAAWANKRAIAAEKKLTRVAPSWLKLASDKKSFELVPERVEIVRKMFEDSKGGMGAISITRRLNQQGIPTWRKRIKGKGWQQSTVKKILDSKTVLGEYTPHHRVNGKPTPLPPIPSYYPAIISEELFYAAKASRNSRRRRGGRKGKLFTSLFSTLVRCGYCGMAVRVHNKGPKPKGGVYMRCNAAIRGLDCKATSWSYEEFEANFLSLMYQVDLGKALSDDTRKRVAAELAAQRDVAKAKAEEAQKGQKNLIKLAEAGSDPNSVPEELLERIKALGDTCKENQKLAAQLDRQLRVETATVVASGERQKELIGLMERMKTAPEENTFALRAKLAQQIRELVDLVLLFPVGGVSTSQSRSLIEKCIKAAGGDDQSVTDHFFLQEGTDAVQPKNYFVIFKSGHYNSVTPSATDATLFKYIATSSKADVPWIKDAMERTTQAHLNTLQKKL